MSITLTAISPLSPVLNITFEYNEELSITTTRPQVPIGQIPYTLSLNAHFQSAYGISKIESNCNITPLEYTDTDKTAAKVSLAQGHKFERDVELLVYYNEVSKPSATVESALPDAKAASQQCKSSLIVGSSSFSWIALEAWNVQ
ncbi:Hypothetical predicted protein [Pelobates cultripes]|uniref:Uncharacterized protein n=1 Tax=Pelobates cultripes TaxID=61616 RepID=A0AAD1SEJ7_PELCU|nr:Hypothetical predicted protein [Pelobates cultripes]